ncbi:hypothetical protein MMC16_005303 [Acarospora aff. strigata]|nr:hypothetical protein [Acarospora aff. strigata]
MDYPDSGASYRHRQRGYCGLAADLGIEPLDAYGFPRPGPYRGRSTNVNQHVFDGFEQYQPKPCGRDQGTVCGKRFLAPGQALRATPSRTPVREGIGGRACSITRGREARDIGVQILFHLNKKPGTTRPSSTCKVDLADIQTSVWGNYLDHRHGSLILVRCRELKGTTLIKLAGLKESASSNPALARKQILPRGYG